MSLTQYLESQEDQDMTRLLSSWKHKKQLGKGIIPSCKIHMVEEETLEECPKGGGKEELGEEE